jgi:mRNA interferase HigB
MQVIALRTLRRFWERHPQAQRPLRAWYALASQASWRGPADVKKQFGPTVDLAGNKYRLVVHVAYAYKRVLVKFVGTHAEYDRIDVETVR